VDTFGNRLAPARLEHPLTRILVFSSYQQAAMQSRLAFCDRANFSLFKGLLAAYRKQYLPSFRVASIKEILP
jgi:hypothetical protein